MPGAVPWIRGVIMLAVALCVSAVPGPVHAQIVEVPEFQVAVPVLSEFLQSSDVAVGADGTIVFAWSEIGRPERLSTRRYAADGTPLGERTRIDLTGRLRKAMLEPDTRGGFIAVMEDDDFPSQPNGRLVDATGVGVGAEFSGSCEDDASFRFDETAAAGLPSGMVFAYGQQRPFSGLRACLLDEQGRRRGSGIEIAPAVAQDPVLTATPDGGFVAVFDGGGAKARFFTAAGVPSEPFELLDDGRAQAVAADGSGGYVVVGVTGPTLDNRLFGQRFTAAGVTAAPFPIYEGPPGSWTDPDVAIDPGGNIYVVWIVYAPEAVDRGLGHRGFDASGIPFGPAMPFSSPGSVFDVQTAALPDGRFVNTWARQHVAWGNIVSLCAPGISLCGDGVLVAQCETCDDGVGNSDTAPDACRTDCRPARCGDMVVDSGETCDDGNHESCDGCSGTCEFEVGLTCGDGVVASSCGETCDDANADPGDGCSPTCALERIPGKGSRTTDCLAEWSVVNPGNTPFRDKLGAVHWNQRCVDGDARCDFDPNVGACRFRVRVCANNTDVPGCTPPSRLASWVLTKPTAAKAARDPVLAEIRTAFAGVPQAVVGPGARDVCSDFVEVPVSPKAAAGGVKAGTLKLNAAAADYEKGRDKDLLRLTCVPAGAP